jgi:hypothetical protein
VEEKWAPIIDFEGYSVSTQGRVRNDDSGRIMTLQVNKQGNVYASLYNAVGRKSSVGVARAMMETFMENPFARYDYNVAPIHIDGDLTNNHIDNLAVRSRSYAIRYQAQFPLDSEVYWFSSIVERTTGLVFKDSREAMLHFGVLEIHILMSILHEDKVPLLNLHFRRNT